MLKETGVTQNYVNQWLMLQQNEPEDYVIATGRTETVRKFIEISAEKLKWNGKEDGPAIIWEGSGLNEIGRRADNNEIVVKIDKRYFRPTEVDELVGDSDKAYKKLGWEPKTTLEELVEEMINEDLNIAYKELRESEFKLSKKFKESNLQL